MIEVVHASAEADRGVASSVASALGICGVRRLLATGRRLLQRSAFRMRGWSYLLPNCTPQLHNLNQLIGFIGQKGGQRTCN